MRVSFWKPVPDNKVTIEFYSIDYGFGLTFPVPRDTEVVTGFGYSSGMVEGGGGRRRIFARRVPCDSSHREPPRLPPRTSPPATSVPDSRRIPPGTRQVPAAIARLRAPVHIALPDSALVGERIRILITTYGATVVVHGRLFEGDSVVSESRSVRVR